MVNRCILSAISHSPILPIQTPILYRLRQMPDFDMFRIIQVGYRAGDFQDTVIGTGGEAERRCMAVLRMERPEASGTAY